MAYETYRSVFTIAAIAGTGMAIVSIVLFFWLKIPSIIRDLTGVTARRGIEAIRNGNTKSGDKKYGSSKVNIQRGKLTNETTVLSSTVSREENETTLLSQSQENVFEILQDITIIHTEEMIALP